MIKRKFNKYLLLSGILLVVLAAVAPSIAAYEGHMVDIRARVEGGLATRSPGFWQTHVDATWWVFTERLNSRIDLGWPTPITNMNDLMGVFWADTAKNSDNSDRSELCQWKEKCAFQALAAVLNDYTP
jgi:hypothetical protein